MSKLCPVCRKPIDKKANWRQIQEMDFHELWQVGDIDLPEEALPEDVQVLYNNWVHAECYEYLE